MVKPIIGVPIQCGWNQPLYFNTHTHTHTHTHTQKPFFAKRSSASRLLFNKLRERLGSLKNVCRAYEVTGKHVFFFCTAAFKFL